MQKNELSVGEANGILEVISKYANSFKTLQEFDEGRVVFRKAPKPKKMLFEQDALKMICDLKRNIHGGEFQMSSAPGLLSCAEMLPIGSDRHRISSIFFIS